MALNLRNISQTKQKLDSCDVAIFKDSGNSFRYFTTELKVNSFRHIQDLHITFKHPVTVIAGNNKIGKTSILLLLACSHENFKKIDSTSPTSDLRIHSWRDVLSFTSHENVNSDYSYEMKWRVGESLRSGEGKWLASSKAWSGLGKKSSSADRVNAKIRDREVRMVDLERVLPGRSFSSTLLRKANVGQAIRLNPEIEEAFAYIFDLETVEINEIGSYVNKYCFLINTPGDSYSSFNAASGEESVIYLLKDLIDSPPDSLILIDEIEAGFHPSVQRKLADIIQYISWRDKKQFIVSTHSPTLLSTFPSDSRRFIERTITGEYRVIEKISQQAAYSKMDSIGHPLVRLYCEDELASFLVRKIVNRIGQQFPHFGRLFNIIISGPANKVRDYYVWNKEVFEQLKNKIGYCAVFDGDKKDDPEFSIFFENEDDKTHFLYPYEAPEKFLIRAYLDQHNNHSLHTALSHKDHHTLFQEMVALGLAADESDARSLCYDSFMESPEFEQHQLGLERFLKTVVFHFS